MELKLKKISQYGENGEMLQIAITVDYGYNGEMFSDLLRFTYNMRKREAYLTVRIHNPGVGSLVDQILSYITRIDFRSYSLKNPPLLVLQHLSDKFGLQYDEVKVARALEKNS